MKNNIAEFGCPVCGNKRFYTKVIAYQYYLHTGEPNGFAPETAEESKFAHCTKCGKKVSYKKLTHNYLYGGNARE